MRRGFLQPLYGIIFIFIVTLFMMSTTTIYASSMAEPKASHPIETIQPHPVYDFSHPIETMPSRPLEPKLNNITLYERLPKSFLMSYLESSDPWSAILYQFYLLTFNYGPINYSPFETSVSLYPQMPGQTLVTCTAGLSCNRSFASTLNTCGNGMFCNGGNTSMTCVGSLFGGCGGGYTSNTCFYSCAGPGIITEGICLSTQSTCSGACSMRYRTGATVPPVSDKTQSPPYF